ncbi:MAG: four helix bundle protein [Patescibacteria group bacterium]
MNENELERNKYDLEERTFELASKVRVFVKAILKNSINQEDIKQLLRSSGSVGANYIEANEALSENDFIHRIKICRKEAKESRFWLRLLYVGDDSNIIKERDKLIQEALELTKIFGKIINNKASSQ